MHATNRMRTHQEIWWYAVSRMFCIFVLLALLYEDHERLSGLPYAGFFYFIYSHFSFPHSALLETVSDNCSFPFHISIKNTLVEYNGTWQQGQQGTRMLYEYLNYSMINIKS